MRAFMQLTTKKANQLFADDPVDYCVVFIHKQ